ncbi:hypothetical protein [Lactiplantibacillus pentosus]|uniref:hypothetical protein n=1 Tax=Lactiplantibacillus pentosus TaxID=1589 RepID=UPI0021A36014|nr:hypothetical protein [Lactiplantibacillus pentosus]
MKKANSRGLNAGRSQTVYSAGMLVYTLLICRFDHLPLNFGCHWTCILMGSLLDYTKCSATLYLVYRAPPTIYSV